MDGFCYDELEILCRNIREKLTAGVEKRLAADAKVGFLLSGGKFEQLRQRYDHAQPFTKESLLYREIFEKYYPGQSQMAAESPATSRGPPPFGKGA